MASKPGENMTIANDIKDIELATGGRYRIEWAGSGNASAQTDSRALSPAKSRSKDCAFPLASM